MAMSEPLSAAIGWSLRTSGEEAGQEAAESARDRLAPHAPQLAIVLGSSRFNQSLLLHGVRSVLGSVPLAGQSTAGEIVPQGPISHSCVILLLASKSLACSIGVGEGADRVPREAGQQAAYAAVKGWRGAPRAGFLVFGDGRITGHDQAIRGIQEVLGTSSLIVGGMADADLRSAQTYQYAGDRVVQRAVVGILLGGFVKLGIGIEHGFAPISKPRRITRARTNILYELDHQPATSVYEEYFGHGLLDRMRQGGWTRETIAYPLGIQHEASGRWLLRNVTSLGERGSLLCNGEVLEGAWLRLMIGSRQLALEAAATAAQRAIQPLQQVACVLLFDSMARKKLLGPHQSAAEVAKIREVVGPGIPLAGCYTVGEQAPLDSAATHGGTASQTGSVLVVAIGT